MTCDTHLFSFPTGHAVFTAAGPDTTVPNMEFEDYTAYNNLSDEELLQLAIERSLTEQFLEGRYIHPPPDAPRTPCPSPSPSPSLRPSFKHEYDSPTNKLYVPAFNLATSSLANPNPSKPIPNYTYP